MLSINSCMSHLVANHGICSFILQHKYVPWYCKKFNVQKILNLETKTNITKTLEEISTGNPFTFPSSISSSFYDFISSWFIVTTIWVPGSCKRKKKLQSMFQVGSCLRTPSVPMQLVPNCIVLSKKLTTQRTHKNKALQSYSLNLCDIGGKWYMQGLN